MLLNFVFNLIFLFFFCLFQFHCFNTLYCIKYGSHGIEIKQGKDPGKDGEMIEKYVDSESPL